MTNQISSHGPLQLQKGRINPLERPINITYFFGVNHCQTVSQKQTAHNKLSEPTFILGHVIGCDDDTFSCLLFPKDGLNMLQHWVSLSTSKHIKRLKTSISLLHSALLKYKYYLYIYAIYIFLFLDII